MKKIILMFMVLLMVAFSGCSKNSPEKPTPTPELSEKPKDEQPEPVDKEDKDSVVEVTFLNYMPSMWRDMEELQSNVLIDEYEQGGNAEALYAFTVQLERYWNDGKFEPSDYPYCCYNQDNLMLGHENNIDRIGIGLCTVAGTREDIRRLFDGTEPLEHWYCEVQSAPRPDLLEVIKKAGWTGGEIYSDKWGMEEHKAFFDACLGSEHQVTMKVKVE